MKTPSGILQGEILIVDDQEVNILLLKRILQAAGYLCVTSTTDPSQVCALHLKNRYDLILLDLQMPGMDGFQVMDALKEIEPEGYLPVLVITAQPGHRLRAFEAGAKDFISKPFELADVLARVRNMLEVRLLHQKLHNYNDLLEKQVREQATLLAISHTLASTLEFQPELILDQLREIVEYTQGGLFALEGSSLVSLGLRGTKLLDQSVQIHLRLNTSEDILALFNKHQPLRVSDIWAEEPQAQSLRSLLGDDVAVLLDGMKSWMWVPLAVKGRLVGGLGLAEATEGYFTDHHAGLALSVADQSAITMVNADLAGQARAFAVLQERQHMARDLHDAVNQSLFSASLIAEALPRLWGLDQDDALRSLEDLRLLTRGAIAEMRAILAELRPETLTDSRISDLLRLQGNAFSGRTSVPVFFTAKGDFSLPPEVHMAFYQVCQEMLNNIAKHAKASRVEMDLTQDDLEVVLRICDDGQGFDPEQTFSGHYGLGMMRERAEAAGALLSVTSQPGHGTQLSIRWMKTLIKESV